MKFHSFSWYADHSSDGEIQLSCDSWIELVTLKRVTLFCPRMAFERLKSEAGSEIRQAEILELSLGKLGVDIIDPAIRKECSIDVPIPPHEIGCLMICTYSKVPDDKIDDDPLLNAASHHLCKWMEETWDKIIHPK